MERHQEDMFLRIVDGWNAEVGAQLRATIEGYRSNIYYSKRHDEQFAKDLKMLLDKIDEQADKRPAAVKDATARARKMLDTIVPLRKAS